MRFSTLIGGIAILLFTAVFLGGCAPKPEFTPRKTVIKHFGDVSYFEKLRSAKQGDSVSMPFELAYNYVIGSAKSRYMKHSRELARENSIIEAAKMIEAYEDSLNHAVLSEVVSEEDMKTWGRILGNASSTHWRSDIIAILDTCFVEIGCEIVWAEDGEYQANMLGKFPQRCKSLYWTEKIDRLMESANLDSGWKEKIKMTRTYREELKLIEDFFWD